MSIVVARIIGMIIGAVFGAGIGVLFGWVLPRARDRLKSQKQQKPTESLEETARTMDEWEKQQPIFIRRALMMLALQRVANLVKTPGVLHPTDETYMPHNPSETLARLSHLLAELLGDKPQAVLVSVIYEGMAQTAIVPGVQNLEMLGKILYKLGAGYVRDGGAIRGDKSRE